MIRFDPETEENLRILAATPEAEIQGYKAQGRMYAVTTITMAKLWVSESEKNAVQDCRKVIPPQHTPGNIP
ncbi:TPA: hypothetical protein HA338_06265 [Methanosarcina acetivorans]|uniref:Uncharacterized protein n=2 Tax=Methanosarcina acetivorans TaxID=2214 RepID=Q8TJE8_METAC|nr:hypothetical protein [Methanosarcina acetivorans]AAM07188.1 predicted protein [Methanosarcina acetivorans C2A]HIH93644.1 hypothetical protein [Methanosarcina acetivorans]